MIIRYAQVVLLKIIDCLRLGQLQKAGRRTDRGCLPIPSYRIPYIGSIGRANLSWTSATLLVSARRVLGPVRC